MTSPIVRDGWDAQHIREAIDNRLVPGHWVAEFPDPACPPVVFDAREMLRYQAMADDGKCTIRAATKADVEADNARFEARAKAECERWGSE